VNAPIVILARLTSWLMTIVTGHPDVPLAGGVEGGFGEQLPVLTQQEAVVR
jgi:hypothetical protein